MTETSEPCADAATVDDFVRHWSSAELAGDTTVLDQLLVDDFTGVGPLGFLLSKADWLDRHHDHALHYRRYALAEVRVQRYQGAAVVVARQDTEGDWRGHPLPEALRISLVLVPGAIGWQLALAQTSFVAGTPGAPPIPGPPHMSQR